MSKSKKRTISSLIKTRSRGRLSGGFDLLGDGERILNAVSAEDILEVPAAKKGTPPPSSLDKPRIKNKSSVVETASTESAQAKKVAKLNANTKNAIKVITAAESADQKKIIEEAHKSKGRGGKAAIANRDAFHLAVREIERLKAERETATLVDNHVIDTLFAKINNVSACVVYMYLWRRTVGMNVESVKLSMRVLSDAIGISRRTAHEAIKRLNEMQLIKSSKESFTGIPEHTLLKSWKK